MYLSIKTQKEYYDKRLKLLNLIEIGENAKAELSYLEHMFPVSWDNKGIHNTLEELPLE